MKQAFLLTMIASICFSCSQNSKKLYLGIEEAEGISTLTAGSLDGLEIGKVEKLSIGKRWEIWAELSIETLISLPQDSRFSVESQDVLGTPTIAVHLGNDSLFLMDGDTVFAESRIKPSSDSLQNVLDSLILQLVK